MIPGRALKIAVLAFSTSLALTHIHLDRPRHMTRSKTRSCFAIQKTVAGAMEMYNLDKNTKRTTLDSAFFHDLKKGGYLESIPEHPGLGPGSSAVFRESTSGAGVTCLVHGPIR